MSFGSFSAALSGLRAHATFLSVIGNNLANINTTGFKASTVAFKDLFSQILSRSGATSMQVGLGVATSAISPSFTQGLIDASRESTNMAIQGDGFFIVNGPHGSAYTRAGVFSFDASGALVTPEGFRVQGYTTINPLTGAVVVTGQPNDIIIPPGLLHAPTTTTLFQAVTNLSADAAVGDTFTTSVQIYDSLGASHVLTVTYTNTGPGAWSYDVTVPGADVAGGTPGTPFSIATGTMTFGPNGQLATVNGGAPADVTLTTPAWNNGAAASTITWDLVSPTNQGYVTGFGAPSDTSAIHQNGTAAGSVTSVNISEDGSIVVTLNSGQAASVARVALATFNNPKGLLKLGSNLYGATPTAGSPNVGAASSGGRGGIMGSALELSNVDVAQELTHMILAQRGYQANSKSITVTDELMVDTLNLKR
jgi:flagellar hook protein FlgE